MHYAARRVVPPSRENGATCNRGSSPLLVERMITMKERFEKNKTAVIAAISLLVGIVLGESPAAEAILDLVAKLTE